MTAGERMECRDGSGVGAGLGPERPAFVEALRTVFFDRLKDEGVTYADIRRRLGMALCSPATLSRIASGQKLPEKAEEHLWQLYLRAVGAKNPGNVPYYQYLRDIVGVRERQQAMVAVQGPRTPYPRTVRTTTLIATIPPSRCAMTQPLGSIEWPAPESRYRLSPLSLHLPA